MSQKRREEIEDEMVAKQYIDKIDKNLLSTHDFECGSKSKHDSQLVAGEERTDYIIDLPF